MISLPTYDNLALKVIKTSINLFSVISREILYLDTIMVKVLLKAEGETVTEILLCHVILFSFKGNLKQRNIPLVAHNYIQFFIFNAITVFDTWCSTGFNVSYCKMSKHISIAKSLSILPCIFTLALNHFPATLKLRLKSLQTVSI